MRWQLAGGDPTWLGWLAGGGYVGAACLCVRAARVPRDTEHAQAGQRRLAYFWLLLAVLLLALHRELAGRPAEIKRVLCATAIDLGRESYFQGAGLLDILHALESV